jgi:asparagine synthase (glutamine-hydrolysing)
MCGIAGVVDRQLTDEEFPGTLERMGEAQNHRGPDESGFVFVPELRAGIACRRLSIIDLENGRQPISNEGGTVHVVLNGEIYNHRALRRSLEERGHRFRTHADTEVIVHLYEDLGLDCLPELNGMFGLAILDTRSGELILARDRAGMKPLYYAETPHGFLFASEIKALLASGRLAKEPDWEGVDSFLSMGYVPAPKTCFRAVRSLRAGTYLVAASSGLRTGGLKTGEFWQLRFNNANPQRSEAEYGEEVRSLLDASVKSHLAADVTVGAMVSGGWDSSLVAALAARHTSGKLKTFSLTLPDSPAIDESRYQRTMARHLDSEHYEIEFTAKDIPELIPKGIEHLEQPFEGPALLDFQIARLTSSQVKVALSGQGADELFAGYPWTVIDPLRRVRRIVPPAVARLLIPAATRVRQGRIARIVAAEDEGSADIEFFRILTRPEISQVLSPDVPSGGADLNAYRVDPRILATCRDRLQRRLGYDYSLLMPNIILNYHDKMSMAHSLEVRLPFLDRAMIDFAVSLPSDMKLGHGKPKYILSLLGDLLPDEVRYREKQCLQYPLNEYLNGPLKPFTREFLLDSNGSSGGLFNRSKLEPLLERWISPRNVHLRKPWSLIGLQAWWNQFFTN